MSRIKIKLGNFPSEFTLGLQGVEVSCFGTLPGSIAQGQRAASGLVNAVVVVAVVYRKKTTKKLIDVSSESNPVEALIFFPGLFFPIA